jgi:predicted RNA-binding protein YlxR (DUF448 family)
VNEAVDSSLAGRPADGPVRTCVGCRRRAPKSDLLRVVSVEGVLVPDPRGRRPGRGAYLHLDPACVDLAERRRAFSRALRVSSAPHTGALRAWLAEGDGPGFRSTTVHRPNDREHHG